LRTPADGVPKPFGCQLLCKHDVAALIEGGAYGIHQRAGLIDILCRLEPARMMAGKAPGMRVVGRCASASGETARTSWV
jgi:hypothetical protein